MKRKLFSSIILAGLMATILAGCQKGDLLDNPNVASTSSTVPVSLILNRITNELYQGGGVLDDVSGYQQEGPWTRSIAGTSSTFPFTLITGAPTTTTGPLPPPCIAC
jgi:hypothetical protein